MFPLNVEMPVIKKDGTRTTLGDITGDISSLVDDIESLDSRLDTAEGDISTAQSDITSLDGRLDTAENNITTMQTTYLELSKIQEFYFEYDPITVAAGGFSGDTASTNTLPQGAIVLGISRLYTGSVHSFLPYFMRILNGKGVLGVKNTASSEQTTTLSMAVMIYNPNAT